MKGSNLSRARGLLAILGVLGAAPALAAPTVTITNSVNGSVSGILNLTAVVNDTASVWSVSIAVDGVAYGPAFLSNGVWSYPFNTNYVGNTQHIITATAQDTAGQSGSASLTFTSANAPAYTQAHPHSGIGTNTTQVEYYSAGQPFLNLFKAGYGNVPAGSNFDLLHGWFTGSPSGGQMDVNVDANGWPKSMKGVGGTIYGSISTDLLASANYPAGTYVVLYEGTGTLKYGRGLSLSSHSPGRDILTGSPNPDGLEISITATDPNQTGDYVRNIQLVYSPDSTATTVGKNEQALLNGAVFSPDYLAKIASFSSIRFTQWAPADAVRYNSIDRPLPSHAFWDSHSGVPAELMIALANQTGADAWISIPIAAATPSDDSFVRWLAAYASKNLGKNQHVYLEYADEMWNGREAAEAGFGSALWWSANSVPAGELHQLAASYYGMRTALNCQEWKSAWSSQGRNSADVICVMGNQAGNPKVAQDELNCSLAVAGTPVPAGAGVTWNGAPCAGNYGITAIGDAPYFPQTSPTSAASEDDVCRAVTASVPAAIGALKTDLNFVKSNVSKYGPLSVISYEGGPQLSGANTTGAQTIFDRFWTSACMYSVYTTFLQQYQAAGLGVFNNFSDLQTLTPSSFKNGQWGNLDDIWQATSKTATPKYQALVDFAQSGATMTGGGATLGITITTPTASAAVSGIVNVAGTTTGNATVTAVYLSTNNGTTFSLAAGTSNWTSSLNTAVLNNGPLTITAKAIDAVGNTSIAQTTVTVSNAASGLSVTVNAPTSGATLYNGTVLVSGMESGGIAPVYVWVDNIFSGSTPGGSTAWTYSLNASALTPGAHTITVAAQASGITSTPVNIPVVVTASSAPLNISITAPAANAVVWGMINVTGVASGLAPLGSVLISTDNVHFAPATGSLSNWSFSLNTTGIINGNATLYARVADRSGNTVMTQEPFTVANDGLSVTISSPAANSTVSGVITLAGTSSDAGLVQSVSIATDGVHFTPVTGPLSNWTFSLNTLAMNNGPQTITAKATDGLQTLIAQTSVTVNNAGLTVSITTPTANATVSGIITIAGTTADTATVQGVAVSTDALHFTPVTGSLSNWTYSLNTLGMKNGPQTITAMAWDNIGKTTIANASVTVNNASILVSITTPTANATLSGSFLMSGTSSDLYGRSVSLVAVAVDSGAYDAVGGTSAWTYLLNTKVLSPGAHTITARAFDSFGGVAYASVPVTVVNSTSTASTPTISILTPTAGQTVFQQNTLQVVGTATDNATVQSVLVTIDGSYPLLASGTNSWSVGINSPALNTTGLCGTHTLKAQATDVTGNTASATEALFFDCLAVNITTPTANAVVYGTVMMAGNTTDFNATVTSVKVSTDGTDFYPTSGTPSSWTYSLNTLNFLPGTHTLYVEASDNLGGFVEVSEQVIVVSPFLVNITAPTSGAALSGTVTVAGTTSDNTTVTVVQVSTDGVHFSSATGTWSWTYTLNTTGMSVGAHTIYVQAQDNASRMASASVPVTVANSTGAASNLSISITAPAANQTVAGFISVTGVASGALPLQSVMISTDDYHFAPVNGSLSNWTFSLNTTGLPNGNATITVKATDSAGNTAVSQVAITIANAAVAAGNVSVAFPNPVPARTAPTLRAIAPTASTVKITVYDLAGRPLYSASLNGAPTGTTASGQPYYDHQLTRTLPIGVYFAVIQTFGSNGSSSTSKTKFAVVP